MRDPKITITVVITANLERRVKVAAREDSTSVSAIARQALTLYLNRRELITGLAEKYDQAS